jgi:hypothetical protein
MAIKFSEELSISQTWNDAGDFQRSGTDIFPIVGALYCEFVFTAHSTTLPYSCPAHYDMSDGVQWQFVFTAHSTTLPYSCPAHYDMSDGIQWQFVFTAHTTTLPYSCPAHYDSFWCCTVIVTETLANLCIWTRLILCDTLYSTVQYSIVQYSTVQYIARQLITAAHNCLYLQHSIYTLNKVT